MFHSKGVTNKKGNKGMTKHYIRGSIIWLNYYVDGVRKQKSTKLKNTPKNIKLVENQIIPALDLKIATGEIYKKKPKTFKYYGDIYLKQKSNDNNYFQYRGFYNIIFETFGLLNITEITRLDIKKYLMSLTISSKNPYKIVLKGVFELALDDGLIDTNPALNIKLDSIPKKKVEYYTKDEVSSLINSSSGLFRVYLMIAFNTGMRSGEILGLQLGDFEKNYIHIKRTRTKGIVGIGKNVYSNRKVPYPAYILDEVKKIQSDNIFIFGSVNDSGLWHYKWAKCVEKAKVKRLRLYCTRHTYATLMLKHKIVSINELSGILGHSSVRTTLDKYTGAIDSEFIDLGLNFNLYCDDTVTVKKQNSI